MMKLAGDAPVQNRLTKQAMQERKRLCPVGCLCSLTCLHIGVSVPQFAAGFVRKIFVNSRNAGVPHVATILIAEQTPVFPEILVVRVNAAADVTVSARPRASLDINAFPDETERRSAFEGFH